MIDFIFGGIAVLIFAAAVLVFLLWISNGKQNAQDDAAQDADDDRRIAQIKAASEPMPLDHPRTKPWAPYGDAP